MARVVGTVTNKSSYFTFFYEYSAVMNIEGNYHDVTVATYIETNNTSHTFDTSGERDHSITVGSDTRTISKRIDCNPWGDNPYKIQEETFRVYHNDDGTKKIVISARSNGRASEYGYSSSLSSSGDATASSEIELPAIPRASSISFCTPSITLNGVDKIIVNISRASNSFVHTVKFKLGSHTQTYNNVGTSQEFVMPLLWLNAFGSVVSGSLKGSIEVQTYNGSSAIGNAIIAEFTVNSPSASTILSSTANIECNSVNSIDVNISRAVNSFVHTVVWMFEGYSYSQTSVGTNTSYAPPTTWLNAIPNALSGTGKVVVTTYYNSQQIGIPTEKTYTLNVPNYTPSLSSVNVEIVQPFNINDWDIYVAHLSKAKFIFNGATGVYGSNIKSYEIVIDKVSYTGTTNSVMSNELVTTGTLTWVATVTDTRNKSKTLNGDIIVQALIIPQIVSYDIYRYDGFEKNDEGTQLYFNFNFSFGSYDGLNSTINSISIKKSEESVYQQYGTFENGVTKIISDYYFDDNSSYDILVVVQDEIGTNPIQVVQIIDTAISLIDADGPNHSLGLLKRTSRAGFVEIGGKLAVDEYIVVNAVNVNVGIDINTMLTPGLFILANGSYSNAPMSTLEGIMDIVEIIENTIVKQVYTHLDGQMWQRIYWDKTWHSWVKLTN